MKDMRGSHVSAVRSTIYRTFKLPLITNHRKNSSNIIEWKQSKDVADSYKKLYNDDVVIENITNSAFPSLATASDVLFSDMYIYTAAVCDIILNPDNPTIEVSKKGIELRMEKFRVFSIKFILFIINFKKKINIINQKLIFLGSYR